MTENTNYPTNSPTPKKENKEFLLITLLVLALLGTWGFYFFSNHKSLEKIKEVETKYIYVDSTRNAVENLFSESLMRLDSLTGKNNELKSQLKGRDGKIQELKSKISKLLKKEKLNLKEISQAYDMIAQLNINIDELKNQVVVLTETNKKLNDTIVDVQGKNVALSTELGSVKDDNKKLNETVEYGSTYYASNIKVKPLDVKKSGKVVENNRFNKIDELLITFDVENRLMTNKESDIYILVIDPKTNFIENGKFFFHGIGNIPYTGVVKVNGGSRNRVEYLWKNKSFIYGPYMIKIYHNGYIIGESVCELKKGGIFGI